MKKSKLPKKLHQLVRLTIKDVKKCHADPKYDFNMNVWHYKPFKSNQCLVCMAGAVMAKTLKLNDKTDHQILPGYFDIKTEHSLMAIDALRNGDLKDALFWMGIEASEEEFDDFPRPIDVPSVNFDEFIASWEKTEKWLAERNL